MKRVILALACAVALASSIPAQGMTSGAMEYRGTMDFSRSIADFAGMAERGEFLALRNLQDKAFLLFGTLTKPVFLDEGPYLAFAEFLEGQWVGKSRLLLHRVILAFPGEEFLELLDGPTGLRAVAIVRNPRLDKAPDGSPVIYLDVIAVKPVF
jgi:hypothetical protein